MKGENLQELRVAQPFKLLGFHTSHSVFKCVSLVKLLRFVKGFFLFSLAETVKGKKGKAVPLQAWGGPEGVPGS
jgi:hypothetical protein